MYAHLAVLVALLLQLAAGALQTPPMPGTQMWLPPVRIEVHDVNYTIVVNEDGTVEPSYSVKGVVRFQPVAGQQPRLQGELVLDSVTVYEPDRVTGRATVDGLVTVTLPGEYEGEPASGLLSVRASYNARLVNGEYEASVTLVVHVAGDTRRKLAAELNVAGNSSKALLTASLGMAPVEPGAEGLKRVPTVDEVNAVLRAAGIYFLRVKELSATLREGREAVVTVKAVVDLDGLAGYLVSKGVSRDVASSLRKFIESARVERAWGNGYLNATVTGAGTALTVRVEGRYSSELQGDVEGLERLTAEYGQQLAAAIVSAVLLIASDVAAASGGTGAGMGLPALVTAVTPVTQVLLYTKPPTQSTVKLVVALTGSEASFELRVREGRLSYLYPTGDPESDARMALQELAHVLGEARKSLATLAALYPGLADLIPSKAYLKPGSPRVRVEPAELPVSRLASARVIVAEAGATQAATETPATPSPTPTPAVTATETRTGTPTAPAQTRTPTHTEQATTAPTPAPGEHTAATQPVEGGQYTLYVAAAAAVVLLGIAAAIILARRR